MRELHPTTAAALPDHCPLLEVLSPSAVRELLGETHVERYQARQPVALAGSHPGRCWLVVDGHVKEHRSLWDGSEVVTDFRGPGDLVAETAAFVKGPSPVDVTTIDDVTALTLDSPRIARLLSLPTVADAFQHAVSLRLLDAQRLLVRNGRQDTEQRAELALLELAERFGQDVPGGRSIGVPACQTDLASWVAMSRESFAKVLRRLRAKRLVSTARCDIVITDIHALRLKACVPLSGGMALARSTEPLSMNRA